MRWIVFALMVLPAALSMISCGGGAKGPGDVVAAMFEAARAGNYDEMLGYMSPEVQREMNVAALRGIEIVSYTIDTISYSEDSTMADIEYTLTVRELGSGDTEVEDNEFELLKDVDGNWVIVDM